MKCKKLGIILLACAMAGPGWAQNYAACVARVENARDSDARQQALDQALLWRNADGGAPAEHCLALAYLSAGLNEQAATRLEALALDPDAKTETARAALLSQAGNAWLLAGRPRHAEAALNQAYKLRPDDGDVLIDRGRAHFMKGDAQAAEKDFTLSIEIAGPSVDGYLFRSEARRRLGNLEGARGDLDRCLTLNAGHSEALLARAQVRLASGDVEGARADLQYMLRSTDAAAPAVADATAMLEEIDAKTN